MRLLSLFLSACLLAAGLVAKPQTAENAGSAPRDPVAFNKTLEPRVVTEPVANDSDDPAIWVNPEDPAASLVIGTDKHSDGSLYVFDLQGKVVKRVQGLKRPNNVDIIRGLMLGGRSVDIAITTEREMQRLRAFRLPEMEPVDLGDLVVFDGDKSRAPMGIACYRRPSDGTCYAFVGGKSGPAQGYVWQYRLSDDGKGHLAMTKVRAFGAYSGRKEIEAIAVDEELGYVYYSDEQCGVRKYLADPDAPGADKELALFATEGFAGDHEGISIMKRGEGKGFILVSNQQADSFRVFPREGRPGKPHQHPLLAAIQVAARESDGSDFTEVEVPGFPGGLFVAMSTDKTFHFYAGEDLARAGGLLWKQKSN